jgi:hypothetical protein
MKKTIKKILLYGSATFLFLCFVLVVHIYFVYRPAPDANTRAMARIDIKQQLTADDANKISGWLYRQKGIDHVLVNPQTNIVIFTFYPVKTSGDQIVNKFKSNFSFKAERIMPSEANLKSSCPVAASSYTYKVYKLITQII